MLIGDIISSKSFTGVDSDSEGKHDNNAGRVSLKSIFPTWALPSAATSCPEDNGDDELGNANSEDALGFPLHCLRK